MSLLVKNKEKIRLATNDEYMRFTLSGTMGANEVTPLTSFQIQQNDAIIFLDNFLANMNLAGSGSVSVLLNVYNSVLTHAQLASNPKPDFAQNFQIGYPTAGTVVNSEGNLQNNKPYIWAKSGQLLVVAVQPSASTGSPFQITVQFRKRVMNNVQTA